jgi:hypothetical protein
MVLGDVVSKYASVRSTLSYRRNKRDHSRSRALWIDLLAVLRQIVSLAGPRAGAPALQSRLGSPRKGAAKVVEPK